jgi:hypothetical protein
VTEYLEIYRVTPSISELYAKTPVSEAVTATERFEYEYKVVPVPSGGIRLELALVEKPKAGRYVHPDMRHVIEVRRNGGGSLRAVSDWAG